MVALLVLGVGLIACQGTLRESVKDGYAAELGDPPCDEIQIVVSPTAQGLRVINEGECILTHYTVTLNVEFKSTSQSAAGPHARPEWQFTRDYVIPLHKFLRLDGQPFPPRTSMSSCEISVDNNFLKATESCEFRPISAPPQPPGLGPVY